MTSGNVLLKLKGSSEGVGKVFGIGKGVASVLDRLHWCRFCDSVCFWDLVEPNVLEDLKDSLKPGSWVVWKLKL